jgi:hypothetical protein
MLRLPHILKKQRNYERTDTITEGRNKEVEGGRRKERQKAARNKGRRKDERM